MWAIVKTFEDPVVTGVGDTCLEACTMAGALIGVPGQQFLLDHMCHEHQNLLVWMVEPLRLGERGEFVIRPERVQLVRSKEAA